MRAEGPGLDTAGVVKKCVLGVGRGVVGSSMEGGEREVPA